MSRRPSAPRTPLPSAAPHRCPSTPSPRRLHHTILHWALRGVSTAPRPRHLQAVIPGGSDQSFYSKLLADHRANSLLSVPAGGGLRFAIEHYAGVVAYDARGFLEKNGDKLLDDLQHTSGMLSVVQKFPREQAGQGK